MTREIIIRKATVKDVSAIVKSMKELMVFHEKLDPHFKQGEGSEADFKKFVTKNINDEKALVTVAEYAGNIVGYTQAKIEKYPPVFERQDYGWIIDLFVAKRYRDKGIGSRIVEEVIKWFRGKGINRIEVRFLTTNEMSSKFWLKMGFKTYLKTAFLEM